MKPRALSFLKLAGPLNRALKASYKNPLAYAQARSANAKMLLAERAALKADRAKIKPLHFGGPKKSPDKELDKLRETAAMRIAHTRGMSQADALEEAMSMEAPEIKRLLGGPDRRVVSRDPWTGTPGSASFSKVGFQLGFEKIAPTGSLTE